MPDNTNNNNNEPQVEEGVIDLDALDEQPAVEEQQDPQPEEENDFSLGEELLDDLPFIMNGILQEEDGEVLFDKLVQNGCIRTVGGKKFTKTGAEGADEIARDIRKGKKYVFHLNHQLDPKIPEGTTVRVADLTYDKSAKTVHLSPDTPDRGADYSIPNPEAIEAPEASEELVAFARKLKAAFDGMGDFRWDKPSDLARVKVYYKDDKDNVIERNAFATWAVSTNSTGGYVLLSGDKVTISPMYSAAEKDMVDSDYSLERFLNYIDRNGIDQYKIASNGINLVHIYAMMQAAKEGRLMFTEPGDTPENSHPIRLDDDGKIEILPKEADASPEQLKNEGYTVGLTLAKSSVHAGDTAYAKELKDYRTKLFTTPLATMFLGDESKINPFINEAIDAGYTKEALLAEIREMKHQPGNAVVDHLNEAAEENGVQFTFTEPKAREKEAKKALSLRARQAYYDTQFDKQAARRNLLAAAGPDTFSVEDYRRVDGWDLRDGFPLLFEISNAPDATDRNTMAMELYSGKINLSAEEIARIPEADLKDMKYRMFAQAFNDSLRTLNSFDFEALKHLSDEQLVEQWTKMSAPLFKISVVKGVLEGGSEIHRQVQDNPYIDRDLVKTILEKETRYINLNMYLNNRMKAIASPEYALTNLEQFEKLTYDESDYVCEGTEEKGQITEYKFAQFATTGFKGMHSVISDDMEYQLRESFKLPYNTSVVFFDPSGKVVQSVNVFDKMRKGEPVFAAAERNPETLTAFTFNKNTGYGVLNPAVLNDKRYKLLKTTLTTRLQEEKEAYENVALLGSRTEKRSYTFMEGFPSIVDEALRKGQTKDHTRTQLKEFIRREPELTLEQFRSIPGINENNEPLPSREEVNRRRALSEKIIMDYFEDAWDRRNAREGSQIDEKLKKLGALSPYIRQFKEVMLIHSDSAEGVAKNEAMVSEFVDGDNETRKKLIEQRFREFKKDEALFEQPLTDEHIAEHFTEIHRVGVPMGMEFKLFMNGVKAIGVDLGPDLEKEMIAFNEKVYIYSNLTSYRAEIMMSQYYPYLNDPTVQDAVIAQANRNPGVQKFGKDCLISAAGIRTFQAQILAGQVLGDKKDEYDIVLIGGKTFAADNYGEYGNLVKDGETITFLKKDRLEALTFDISAKSMIPKGTLSAQQLTKDQILDWKFEAKKSLVDSSKRLKDYEKTMEKRILDAQKELFRVLEDGPENNLFFAAEKEECLFRVLTECTIANMVSMKDLTPDARKNMISANTFDAISHSLLGNPLIKDVLENLPEDKESLEKLTGQDFFNRVLDAQNRYGKNYVKNRRTQEINKKLDKYPAFSGNREDLVKETMERDEKFKAALDNTKQSAKAAHDRLSFEFFGGKKLTADVVQALSAKTQLHSLTLSRNSIQAIALSLMLTQGIPVEAALSDDKEMSQIRQKMTETTMKAIEASDMEFIRQNLAMGIKPLSEYVESKMNGLPAISAEELLKPENRMLLSACQFITDFNQEFENVQKDLPAKTQIHNVNFSKDSIRAITLSLMLTQGISVEAALSDNKEMSRIRQKMTERTMKAIEDGDIAFIRQNLTMGMKPLSEFVDRKAHVLYTASTEELLKPENRMVFSANDFITDFGETLDYLEKEIPAEQKFTSPALESIRDRAHTLALQYETAMAGSVIYCAQKYTKYDKQELETAMAGYLEANMNEAFQTYKKEHGISLIPKKTKENEKPTENLQMQTFQIKAAAQSVVAQFMRSDLMKNMSDDDVKKVFVAMADDTFKKDMGLTHLDLKNDKATVINSLSKAVMKATLRMSRTLTTSAPQSDAKKSVQAAARI